MWRGSPELDHQETQERSPAAKVRTPELVRPAVTQGLESPIVRGQLEGSTSQRQVTKAGHRPESRGASTKPSFEGTEQEPGGGTGGTGAALRVRMPP